MLDRSAASGSCTATASSARSSTQPSRGHEGPLTYADGLVVAIDGGRYDGGPLLLVELD